MVYASTRAASSGSGKSRTAGMKMEPPCSRQPVQGVGHVRACYWHHMRVGSYWQAQAGVQAAAGARTLPSLNAARARGEARWSHPPAPISASLPFLRCVAGPSPAVRAVLMVSGLRREPDVGPRRTPLPKPPRPCAPPAAGMRTPAGMRAPVLLACGYNRNALCRLRLSPAS